MTVPDGVPFIVTATGGVHEYGTACGESNVSCRLTGPGLGGSEQKLVERLTIPAGQTQADWSFALSDQGGPVSTDGSQTIGLICDAAVIGGSGVSSVALYTSRLHLVPVGSLTQG